MGVHTHTAPTVGLGSIGVQMGPDTFITRHLDYTPALGNGGLPFERKELTCEQAVNATRTPFLAILETAWITHPAEAQVELTESFRHKARIGTMLDQDAYSLYVQQTGVMKDEEDNVLPPSRLVDGKRYALHYNIFVHRLSTNLTLLAKSETCPSSRAAPRYELVDEEAHMTGARGRFSDTGYAKPFEIAGQPTATLPYVSNTSNTSVLGHNVHGRMERATLAMPLEVVWLSEANFATNRQELCACVPACEGLLDVTEQYRFPLMRAAGGNGAAESDSRTPDPMSSGAEEDMRLPPVAWILVAASCAMHAAWAAAFGWMAMRWARARGLAPPKSAA